MIRTGIAGTTVDPGDRLLLGVMDASMRLRVASGPWADGTHALGFLGHELMEKGAFLVPMPRANLVRYHGALVPRSG